MPGRWIHQQFPWSLSEAAWLLPAHTPRADSESSVHRLVDRSRGDLAARTRVLLTAPAEMAIPGFATRRRDGKSRASSEIDDHSMESRRPASAGRCCQHVVTRYISLRRFSFVIPAGSFDKTFTMCGNFALSAAAETKRRTISVLASGVARIRSGRTVRCSPLRREKRRWEGHHGWSKGDRGTRMAERANNNGGNGEVTAQWPPRPSEWPPVLDEVQAAQYLHLDGDGRTIESAKRTMRYLRKNAGLPSPGRIARKVLYRRDAIDAWLVERERGATHAGAPAGDEGLR